ncbi:uncharacterized protein LOC141849648 [Brevipalpus obovatus]|uniref:uncharacterized protein LOC141849648 n=1 Tax=Brevipalpus obovatus TaxID=246614 RepID=UPI003D9FA889
MPVLRSSKRKQMKEFYPVTKRSKCESAQLDTCKGISPALLKKIKPRNTKEKERVERERQFRRLLNLLKVIHCHFVMNPRPTQLSILTRRCADSYFSSFQISLAATEIEKLIETMVQLLPDWIICCQVRDVKYIKIVDPSKSFVQLQNQVTDGHKL